MYTFLYKDIFMSLKIVLALANIKDPDVKQHNAAFHLGLLCLPKYLVTVSRMERDKAFIKVNSLILAKNVPS